MGEYLYEHFYGGLLEEDQHFQTGPHPGQRVPEAERESVDGESVKIGGRRDKPMLLTFGSLTCPMTAAAIPILERLHARYGNDIDFVTLYVREAHPGDKVPQPHSYEEKVEHARRLRDEHGIAWTVAVDDLDGTLHKSLDPKPSAAYLIDRQGTVMFRSLWADDPKALRFGLTSFLSEGGPVGELESMVGPLLRGLWYYDEVLREAGPEALEDLRREAPMIYYATRVVRVIRHPVFPFAAAAAVGLGAYLLNRRRA